MDSQSKNGQSWHMRFFVLILSITLFAAPAYALPRVMSLNLCADAYLMAFADKNQIAALTHLSRDPSLSAHAKAADAYPVSDGQIEAIIELKPDIVIVSSWSDPMRNALIERLGFELLVLDAAQDFASARTEILTLGRAIGRAGQAQAYLAALDRQMAALNPRTDKPSVLPLQRRNLTIGRGHIVDEIISLAGAENSGAQLADAMSHVSLETALAARAEFLLLSEASDTADSRGMEFITHPALKAAYAKAQQIHIPHNLLVCSGAPTPRAVATLIEQLNQAQTASASSQ